MNKPAIVRIDETHYDVTIPVMMSDGNYRRDAWCRLVGNQLVSHEDGRGIRVGGLLRVNLSQTRLDQVQKLAIGETLAICK